MRALGSAHRFKPVVPLKVVPLGACSVLRKAHIFVLVKDVRSYTLWQAACAAGVLLRMCGSDGNTYGVWRLHVHCDGPLHLDIGGTDGNA